MTNTAAALPKTKFARFRSVRKIYTYSKAKGGRNTSILLNEIATLVQGTNREGGCETHHILLEFPG